MAKKLIIVESPTKTKTIKNYLGNDYEIIASMGHIRDLPKQTLGVDIENNFEPKYTTISGKRELMERMKKAVKNAETIYLATDPDREGEAIAWHISQAFKLKDPKRIEFNEITKSAITNAIEHPRLINEDRVDAQQARRVLDRLVGYQLSPLLWRKVRRGLSAGRVQSVAVKLIVDREREINAFITEEYWTIIANCKHNDSEVFGAKLITVDGVKTKLSNEEQAKTVEENLRGQTYKVINVKHTDQKRNPSPPYITSTLQQEASNKLNYSSRRTMILAQQLYEGIETSSEGQVGLITYMRTDSTHISKEAEESAKNYILENYGQEYVKTFTKKAKAVRGAQEAHEAIRPTDVYRTPDTLRKYLNPDQLKIYTLIWQRFVASQMAQGIISSTAVDIEAGKYILRANGQQIKFKGFLILRPDRNDGVMLPELKVGDIVDLEELITTQHFTEPAARYTEASLIKALEAKGVGRPSTYAPTISTIIDRHYVTLDEKKFHPTGLGTVVTEQLENHFSSIINPDFTATVETELDEIENGKEEWQKTIQKFYTPFSKALEVAAEKMERVKVPEEKLETPCPECEKELVIREGRFGRFVACSGYPECTYSMSEDDFFKQDKDLDENNSEDDEEKKKAKEDENAVKCPDCGGNLIKRNSRRGEFLGCENYPKCKTTANIDGSINKKGDNAKKTTKLTDVKCEKCGKPMALRNSRRGEFLGCSGFPRCRNIVTITEDMKYNVIEEKQ